jgi:hypothetical protein
MKPLLRLFVISLLLLACLLPVQAETGLLYLTHITPGKP